MLTPRRFAGPRQLDHHDWLSRPWAYIDHCCRLLGWRAWPSALTNTHADLLTTAGNAAAERLPTKLQSARTTGMVRRLRRHGSRIPATQDRYRREVHQRLELLGLVRRGRGWVEPVDITELVLSESLANVEAVVTALSRRKESSVGLADMARILKNRAAKDRCPPKEGGAAQARDGRRQNGRTQLRQSNGTFGPSPTILCVDPSVRSLPPQNEKKFPLQPLPLQVVEPQRPAPPAVPEVAGAILLFPSGASDADRIAVYGRLHEQQGAFSPAQEADFRQICERDTAHWAAVLQAEEARPPPDPAPAPVSPPPRVARTAAGVQVPAGAQRRHERTVDALAEMLGVPLGEADEAALCLQPATRAQLVAAVPALSFYPHLPEKLAARGLSVAACHHGYAGVAGSPVALRGDVVALTINAAKRTQQYFVGDAGGWNPYGAYMRAKGQNSARWGLRRRPP